jgi:signal transduction histidine kinase/CheY-like chemotaxis protein
MSAMDESSGVRGGVEPQGESLGLARLLHERRDQIVERFVAEVKRSGISSPSAMPLLIVDHIPSFLDEIREELTLGASSQAARADHDARKVARRHGEQRWEIGYDLQAVIREYGLLRRCILEAARGAQLVLGIDEVDALAQCLNVGVSEATAQYIARRDQELRANEQNLLFLAEAGQLLSSSLDYRSTLGRLTALLVPKMADWCVVHLEGLDADDMPIAHVDPNRVALIREIFRRYPLPSDSPYGHPYVLRTGEPQLMREVDPTLMEPWARDAEHLALLRQVNARSWLVVPLRVQQHMFGALTLVYSDSSRRYDDTDLVLAGELARRAGVAIDNARLYELSQDERSRVEAATRAKDEFVAMVSHELRTPLNAILGWIHLVRGGTLSPSRRDYALEVIERNAQAQNRLVADLLDISRIITGKIRINPSQVDVGTLVELVIEGVLPAAEAKRIRVESEIQRDGVLLRGDNDRLQQVVWNLLGNAIKFTPKGGVVRVSLRRVESDLELVVKDSGVGIAADFIPHVFESFRQSDSSPTRAHGGLGIGLSIAKHIVELHGGDIQVDSEGEGRGTTLVVRLPISPLISTTLGISRVPATKRSERETSPPGGLEGIRVLVVDDDPDARELVAYVLQASGVEVRVAGSAAEATSALASYTPHVIVSDIGMPDEDGYALIRSIRTLPDLAKKNIPAIALTAFARNEDRTRALVEGFNQHLSKPVEPAALIAAVHDVAVHSRR